jgi:hypothetical protein
MASTYSFIHKGFVKAVFSNVTALNIIPTDLGEDMIQITVDEESVTRLPTATGTVASGNMFVPVTITLPILKTSGADLLYKKKWMSNGVISGSVDIYDDVNKAWTVTSLSMSLGQFNANGKEAFRIYTIKGNMEVNTNLMVELS